MQTPQRILKALRTMGVEVMWEDHAKLELSGVHSLARKLDAEANVRYPDGAAGGSCDLVVSEYGESIWIEVKFASTYKSDSRPGVPGIPLRRQLVGTITGSALKDVKDKLPTLLERRGVDHVGFLLVVFHSQQLPLRNAEIEQLELKGGLREAPWVRYVEEDWVNPLSEDCRIRGYYWQRPAQ